MKLRLIMILFLVPTMFCSKNLQYQGGKNQPGSTLNTVQENKKENALRQHKQEIQILKNESRNFKVVCFTIALVFFTFLIFIVFIYFKDRKKFISIFSADYFKKFLTVDQFNKEKEVFKSRVDYGLDHLDTKFTDFFNALFIISNGLPVDGIVRGNEEISNNNFELATIYLKQEIFRNPEQTNAWVALAHAYSGLERYKDALNSIRYALKLEQKNPYFNRMGQVSIICAEILMKLHSYKEALVLLEREVLVINPRFEKAHRLIQDCRKKINSQI